MAQRTELDLSGPGWSLWRDEQAEWQADQLFPPGTPLAQIPTNAPTGGWGALATAPSMKVSIPGTVEQYLYHWDPAKRAGTVMAPKGSKDLRYQPSFDKPESKYSSGMAGVSWWYRTISVPDSAAGKQIILHFDSTRYRAEVYLDGKLVAYNLVEGTPFEANLTGLIAPGKDGQLAVRITSPGGWWSWEDCNVQKWGTTNTTVPLSRGFSGITGPVTLELVDPVHIADVYVQNTPAVTDINVMVTVHNDTDKSASGQVKVDLAAKGDKTSLLSGVAEITAAPGDTTQTIKLSYPDAKIWDLDHPNLYDCKVSLDGAGSDAVTQTFGFRWFNADGIGTDAMFHLNGKRIVLRTAISWGLWGTTGIIPSPEMATRQIAIAKELGQNMLNFHRAIGQPWVMDQADQQGLLYFEEPGCYVDGSADPFCEVLVREKLLRMVKRDRSHPCLVIYNMINEQWTKYDADKKPELYDNYKRDMADAHKIDPSRLIVLASAWSRARAGQTEPVKLHMRPFDDQEYQVGWFDFHRAGGPEMWHEDLYKSPKDHYLGKDQEGTADSIFEKDPGEIVYWGEEGAISSPPRLELIKKEVDGLEHKGWDGELYLNWYQQTQDFLKAKNLTKAFPSVDSFTVALSAVAMEHQGRKIEDARICDLNDGYAINGWEAEPYENHSGVVDCFRNPKGDPKLLSYYNQPLYVAVKTRNQVIPSGKTATVDFYIINEKDLKGPQTLHVSFLDPEGKSNFDQDFPVTVTGGEVYGQLLKDGVSLPSTSLGGMWKVNASLKDPKGQEVASGRDQILVVNWMDQKLAGKGAVYETGTHVQDFLKQNKGLEVPAYEDSLGPLDWVVVARPPTLSSEIVAPSFFRQADGKTPGATVTFFDGPDFSKQVAQHTVSGIQFQYNEGASPDPALAAGSLFSVRWEGRLRPPTTGGYLFSLKSKGKTELLINGMPVDPKNPVNLKQGEAVSYQLNVAPDLGRGEVTLSWTVPDTGSQNADALIARAQKDGTTVIIADYADQWMKTIAGCAPVKYDSAAGKMAIGGSWVGGQYFAIDHPLFKDLPVNQAMNWPYQAVITADRSHYGLKMDGEQLIAGCWQSVPFGYATAVGIIPSGKGQILVSTLNIIPRLTDPNGPADTARKLFCNYLEFAGTKRP